MLLIVLFYVLFVCKCVLYYCHRVSNQQQLSDISYMFLIYYVHLVGIKKVMDLKT